MSILTGYTIPGSRRGQAIALPDFCYSLVEEKDANEIAVNLRQSTGQEPAWQTVRGALIRMARERQVVKP
jgi:hypothetical protein